MAHMTIYMVNYLTYGVVYDKWEDLWNEFVFQIR